MNHTYINNTFFDMFNQPAVDSAILTLRLSPLFDNAVFVMKNTTIRNVEDDTGCVLRMKGTVDTIDLYMENTYFENVTSKNDLMEIFEFRRTEIHNTTIKKSKLDLKRKFGFIGLFNAMDFIANGLYFIDNFYSIGYALNVIAAGNSINITNGLVSGDQVSSDSSVFRFPITSIIILKNITFSNVHYAANQS
jgi:hypothetical protein